MTMQTLRNPNEADALIDGGEPAWIFKDSSTCPISKSARDGVAGYATDHPDQPVGRVVVQNHREVSNHIADRLGVTHQTPQVILVKDGEALWHASHFKITAEAMADARAETVAGD